MVDPFPANGASDTPRSAVYPDTAIPSDIPVPADVADIQPAPTLEAFEGFHALDTQAMSSGMPSGIPELEQHDLQITRNDPQIMLIARARRGEPEAIAALLQRDLQHHGIEVSAWARGTTLRLELMSPFCLTKPEAMAFIHNGMDYLQAEGVDAVQVSAYVQGEYDPRWVERLHLRQRQLPLAGPSGQGRWQKLRAMVEGVFGGGVVGETAQRLGTQVRGSWAALAVAASTVLLGAVAIAALSGPEAPDTNPDAEQVVQP